MKTLKWIWAAIFVLGFAVRSTHLLQPADTDSWREADVSAIARNFYHNGTNIFHPQIDYGGNGPGYVESEFQIYTYLIATLDKMFGYGELTGRVVSFIASLATMIVFFKLSRFLLGNKAAIAASLFFAISPILMVISVGIQPEALMLFFYVGSAYAFIRWLDCGARKFYWLAVIFTALALLCKITAANIGIFFLLLIIFHKGAKFLLQPRVILLGALSVIPSVLWYSFCHNFYIHYGNSLGISNEYPWIGWDFFTSHNLAFGLVRNELSPVWTIPGVLIVVLALLFTKSLKKPAFRLGLTWYASVTVFYLITCRTTAEHWAWYYHVFSVPAVSLLVGSAISALFADYFAGKKFNYKAFPSRLAINKAHCIQLILIISFPFLLLSCYIYFYKTKPAIYQTSKFYACISPMKEMIPLSSLILANGGPGKDRKGYALATQIGYFYFWLDRRGFSISVEDLSLKNIEAYKAKGASYFVAEEQKLALVPGLEDDLKRNYRTAFECNGCILFKL